MNRVPVVIVFVFLVQFSLSSAPPSISNIAVTMDTNAAVVQYYVSPDSFCWVQYGVASGTYLWSSVSFASGGVFVSGLCSVPITGLKDGTTYYFLPTARPDADDETNICNTSDCGAVEQSATTPAASVSHLPAAPVSVAANLLSEPDTTGYAIVNLMDGGPGVKHECVAAANVNAPAGYSWAIKAGQTLTQIIAANEMTYGTVFQVPQATTCVVPGTSVRGNGYNLPVLAVDPLATGGSIDAANHRWIIFRTAQNNPADFPPFGARTGPAFFGNYGGFESVTPNTLDNAMDTNGTIFNATTTGQTHHFWIENLKFSVDETQLKSYDVFFVFGRGSGGQPPPFPRYMVMRGNYFHGPSRSNLASGVPSIQGVMMITSDPNPQIAIVGNYMDNVYYTSATGIPQAIYITDCGFKSSCGHGGPYLIDNNYLHGMAMNLYVEVNNHANPSPSDFTVTHNTFYWPYNPTYSYAASMPGYGCRNQIEFKGMTRGLIFGNYFNGQWAGVNMGNTILTFNAVDLTIQSNYIVNAASGFGLSGSGSGAGMVAYSSSGNRILVNNNLLNNVGRTLYNAGGGGIGAPIMEMDSSPSNVTFTNNTVGPIGTDNGTSPGFFYPWILFDGGGGPIAGLTVQNNVLPFGVGGTNYGGGIWAQNLLSTAGSLSHPATPIPNGTVSPVNFASWLASVAGYTDGRPVNQTSRRVYVGSGIQGATVIAGGSGYPNSGSLSFAGCKSRPAGTYTAIAGVIQYTSFTEFGSGCNPATLRVSANGGGSGAVLRPAYGLTTNYNWSGNVDYCTTAQGIDMNQGQCYDLSATMPVGDVWVVGATTAMRMAAAGLPNASSSDYNCVSSPQSSCTAGANIAKLEADLGIVSHISAVASGTTATLSYVAPDSRACSADISADNGTTWTRSSDSGGAGQRSIVLTGLLSNTAYQYRLLCYYDQTQPWFSFPSDSSNLTTSGTFTTGSSGNAALPAGQVAKGEHQLPRVSR